jgi:diguanylate cyclase (GGDEF)-like protein
MSHIKPEQAIILLKLPYLAEPDKQRFAQFCMKCLGMLNRSQFSGAAKLPGLMKNIQMTAQTHECHQEMYLLLVRNSLYICTYKSEDTDELSVKLNKCWQESAHLLASLPDMPSAEQIEHIQVTLRGESEVNDPELLRLHNERFRQQLDQAQERAAQELAQLEQELNSKRSELQESIRLAEIDSLTKIYNRGAYDRRLQESLKHCQRQGDRLSLILLDLDYFKEVNDTLGHQAGDEVLKKMAGYMRQFTRKDVDHVCRMGGDEFAIILFSDTNIASRAAEKILQHMDGKVSIGISRLRSDDTVETLVSRTDEALYKAKERGRGQVVIAEEMTEQVASQPGH